MAKEMIFSSAKKTVYRDGDTAIKEFCEGFPKAEVLNEALCNARVETIEALNVPKILGVTVTDGKWSIIKEYVPGKTLEQLMDENPDKLDEYMSQMVDLQLLIHSQACPLLNKLKEKTIRSLKSVEQLDESTRYELLTRLAECQNTPNSATAISIHPTSLLGTMESFMSLTGYMLPRVMQVPM